ncbi:putative membrane protein [Dyadobacter soli]|uniref:Putative membrane protein n=1 Tax=Dyadobacter soli TaxID=659014 RepID=A0A1G6UNS8_9BACT|nr:bestrophin family ion channel [Dyadobacter soli]SDD43002.1 putative membrane protein [Dyadobacter soli]
MHIGKSYRLGEFLVWTRRNTYILFFFGLFAVVIHEVWGLKWLNVPWPVVALLGTATAFTVGFKNAQTYNRASEGGRLWTDILSLSRFWGVMSLDFLNNPAKSKELIYRHIAWLTALRYYLREDRVWESNEKSHNKEYQRFFHIPERINSLETELKALLPADELEQVLQARNKMSKILGLQSKTVKYLMEHGELIAPQYPAMQQMMKDFHGLQGKCEQLKDSPYPRQYAVINSIFVWTFCFMLPFGIVHDFDLLNEVVNEPLRGYMAWVTIPFSMLISWMYISLEQVGESTENPFEGGANDVPISQISQQLNIELREMLGETNLPDDLQPNRNIIL